jgi:LytS/YehU family sensor histidine kinase
LARVTAMVTNIHENDVYSIGFKKDESTLLSFDKLIQTKVKLKKGDVIEINIDDVKITDNGSTISLIYPIFNKKINSHEVTSTQTLLALSTGDI